jgi:hypothetical protein
MSVLRGLLLDNLGLKLTALVMALLVYLHVYTERPARMMFSFPIQITDLDSTLSIAGPAPAAVTAEMRGTGKQLIRLRLGEPVLKVSLAGVGRGHFERAIATEDLPVNFSEGLSVERMAGPRMLELQIDRKLRRHVPVAARVQGVPAEGAEVAGDVLVDPAFVVVVGPESEVAKIDSVKLAPVRIDSRRDTLRARAMPQSLPEWCSTDPAVVTVRVPIRHAGP